jgi:hypothetical protein
LYCIVTTCSANSKRTTVTTCVSWTTAATAPDFKCYFINIVWCSPVTTSTICLLTTATISSTHMALHTTLVKHPLCSTTSACSRSQLRSSNRSIWYSFRSNLLITAVCCHLRFLNNSLYSKDTPSVAIARINNIKSRAF